MILDSPLGKYRWIENWITIPDAPVGRTNGRTHGVAVLKSGNILVFHQSDPGVLCYSPQGDLLGAWGHFPGAHGLTVVEENGVELLWLTDEVTRKVVKTTLDGELVMSLPSPPAADAGAAYIPTWVAVAETRHGGNGDIWVADGYGSSLVHRYDATGNFLATLDGTDGAGRFNCPHGIALDTRRTEPEFYIADRGNQRFQVYGMDGGYRRTFGADFLNSPDVSVRMGDYLIVPELIAGITVLDGDDRPAASLGFQPSADKLTDWPNDRQWIKPGLFNSPHSACADAHGNIFVVEWITGGRVTKLERLS